MKKTLTLLFSVICIYGSGFAQLSASDFSLGLAGNYTMYKGNFNKSTPGVKIEAGYGINKKFGITVGFIKGMPIKTPSTVSSTDGENYAETPSEFNTNFSTILLQAMYRFIGDEETAASVYVPVGASYVMATSKEKLKQAIPAGYKQQDFVETAKESGLTINIGIGAQYSLGLPKIFAEGGIAFPANQTGNTYIENNIPTHFAFTAGVRIPFGISSDY